MLNPVFNFIAKQREGQERKGPPDQQHPTPFSSPRGDFQASMHHLHPTVQLSPNTQAWEEGLSPFFWALSGEDRAEEGHG